MTESENGQTGCACSACTALNARYKDDPDLLATYRRRLLVRGWAGKKDDVERDYIMAHSTWAKASSDRAREHLAQYRFSAP